MTTFEQFADLVEFYAGRAGAVGDVIDRMLILKLVNLKLAELTKSSQNSHERYTFDTEASTYEYELPDGAVPSTVSVGGVMISETSYNEALKWRYND